MKKIRCDRCRANIVAGQPFDDHMNSHRETDRKQRQTDIANANTHLIVEAGIIPGITCYCRCSECRLVAEAMDEAGYLTRVKDRWWEDST